MPRYREDEGTAVCKTGVLFLTFLIYREEDNEDGYVAHCLQLDIVATGETRTKAIKLLKELIEDAVLAALEDDTLAKLCRPAPRKYWEMLAHATPYQPSKRIIECRINAEPVQHVDYAEAL